MRSPPRKLQFSLKNVHKSTTVESQPRRRLLIADDDTTLARVLSDYLNSKGFEARICYSVSSAREIIEFWHPEFVLIDMLIPQTNALSLLKFINGKSLTIRPRAIVMAKQAMANGIESVVKAGAQGYLLKPFTFEQALKVILPELAAKIPAPEKAAAQMVAPAFGTVKKTAQVVTGAQQAPHVNTVISTVAGAPATPTIIDPNAHHKLDPATKVMLKELHLVNLFLKQAMDVRNPSENLFNLMRMVSLKVKAVRCSFIRCLNEETGVVMASNDDVNVQDLPIQLSNYPEIREVMKTLRVLIIPNVKTSELMAPVRDQMSHTNFETIAVFPIFLRGKFFGVTSLRMEQRSPVEMFYIDHFGQVAAQIISMTLMDSLKAA